jgi:hypothetical protein
MTIVAKKGGNSLIDKILFAPINPVILRYSMIRCVDGNDLMTQGYSAIAVVETRRKPK